MLKRIFLLSVLYGTPGIMLAQEEQLFPSDTVQLSTVQAVADLPITSEIVTKREIEQKNLGQDMPVLLKNATSVVTTSDAGSGIGYTAMRVRGIPQSQINVTFNGVPVNDSESHGVFWVDFPDVSSSTGEVLIQRGVGTSSNGAAAFGGSINLETENADRKPFAEIMGSYGSFNTYKLMGSAGSGDLANGKFNIDGRVSYIQSDGYIDRASSDLFSAAVNAYYRPNANTEFQIMNLFGHEKTYQAWYGVNDFQIKNIANGDRTFNPAGAIWNEDWSDVVGYYDNQVDNYDQNHLHAYWRQKWNNHWKSTATLHYTRGLGYYEEYAQGENLSDYKFNSTDWADVVRRQWLDNHFYGGIINFEGKNIGDFDFYLGASINHYLGLHYGKVVDVVDMDLNSDEYYYENESNKTEFSAFAKTLYHIGDVDLFGDVQIRNINYDADYKENGRNDAKGFTPFDYNWTFVNPKVGINYRINNDKLYASYGMTHREPTRSDILANPELVKPETLHDFELGYRIHGNINFGINAYYMYYLDQLVLTGSLDDVGNPIRKNIGKSYRRGIELDANYDIIPNQFNFFGNLNLSQNKNLDYSIENLDGTITSLGDTAIPYTPNIITSFGIDYYPVQNLHLNFTNKYVDKQFVTNTENDRLALDSYFVSDVLASYDFNWEKIQLQLSLLVNNIFDQEYANNGYYGDWDDSLYYYPQAGRNFLTGIKIKF